MYAWAIGRLCGGRAWCQDDEDAEQSQNYGDLAQV